MGNLRKKIINKEKKKKDQQKPRLLNTENTPVVTRREVDKVIGEIDKRDFKILISFKHFH